MNPVKALERKANRFGWISWRGASSPMAASRRSSTATGSKASPRIRRSSRRRSPRATITTTRWPPPRRRPTARRSISMKASPSRISKARPTRSGRSSMQPRAATDIVSLEVSPYLALDTAATMAEGRRLWHQVRRDNLMIKVPATEAGLPAIRGLLGEGINVNITLLFSQTVYEKVAEAFLAGAERFAADGGDLRRLASVASFFVSRIDSEVDKRIDEGRDNALAALKGKVAVANAKLAYQRYQRIVASARWRALKSKGARPQRLLWASTGTKNKAYSDVLYVESLIGRDTVNTMPPATMDAFRDHGTVRPTLQEAVDEAERVMAALERGGISIDEVCAKLVEEGVQLFTDAHDKLLAAVARKRASLLDGRLDRQHCAMPGALRHEVDATLEAWRAAGNVRRLWARDAALWSGGSEADWLGWLDIAARRKSASPSSKASAPRSRVRASRTSCCLAWGDRASGPRCSPRRSGASRASSELLVLDSTDPAQIRSFERQDRSGANALSSCRANPAARSSPNILKQYFFARAEAAVGSGKAGVAFRRRHRSRLEAAKRRRSATASAHICSACRASAGAIRCCRISGWCRPRRWGSMSAKLLDRPREWCARAARRAAGGQSGRGARVDPGRAGQVRARQGDHRGLARHCGFRRLARAAPRGIDRQARQGAHSGRWRAARVRPRSMARIACSSICGFAAEPDREAGSEPSTPSNRPAIRSCASPSPIATTSVRNSSVGRLPPPSPARSSASIRSISRMSRRARSRRASSPPLTRRAGTLPPERPFFEERGLALFAERRTQRRSRPPAATRSLASGSERISRGSRRGDYCALLAYVERNERHHRRACRRSAS